MPLQVPIAGVKVDGVSTDAAHNIMKGTSACLA